MPGQDEVTAVLRGVQSVDGRVQETNVPFRRVSRVVTKLDRIHFSGSNVKYLYQVCQSDGKSDGVKLQRQ